MLEETTRGGNEDVHPRKSVLFLLEIFASDDEAGGEGVERANLTQHLKDLNSKLSGWRDDEGTEAIARTPTVAVEHLEYWNEERKRLSGSGACGAENITSTQGEG